MGRALPRVGNPSWAVGALGQPVSLFPAAAGLELLVVVQECG